MMLSSRGHAISYHLKLTPDLADAEEYLDAAACTTSINLGLQQCETVLRHLTPNTEPLGRCSRAPNVEVHCDRAGSGPHGCRGPGVHHVHDRSLERALPAATGMSTASEMPREAGESAYHTFNCGQMYT